MTVLDLREITLRFGATEVLGGVDLSLGKGEVHALIGENGAGKSSLMNVISGAVQADGGEMKLRGELYTPSNALDARKKGIALIHQELSLAPHLSVAENILMGIEDSRFGWLNRKTIEQQAQEVLANFNHPDIKPETLVGKLSPPAQQIVEICRALAAKADIILMDEPTSSLQRDDVDRLFTLIRKLKASGISIVYISHFIEEVREIADRYTVLRDGRSVSTGEIADVSDDILISQMVGRSVDALFPARQKIDGNSEAIFIVEKLSAPPTLKSASFELKRGEILGIAGLMGAGRTEMIRAILGLDKARSGKIRAGVRTFNARTASPSFTLQSGVGYLSEDRKNEGLALALSIADNITVTRFSSCSRLGVLDVHLQDRQSDKLINSIGIRARSSRQPVQTLSGGNQQKVGIARLVHQQADILLLDEPTRGIDIGSKAAIYETIRRLADEGKAILIISSYLPELFGVCDRLAVMTRGVLSDSRPICEWTPECVLQAAVAPPHEGQLVENGN